MTRVTQKRKGCNKTTRLGKPLKERGKANDVWPGFQMYRERERESLLVKKTIPMAINGRSERLKSENSPYPTAFPYGNGMVLHFYQQQESSTTKTVHKVINKGLKTYV